MALHTHQTVNSETTAFKCWRSFTSDGRGKSFPVVYVEIYEGYDSPGWAGGNARRTTTLQLTREVLEELAGYFTQLADGAEPDESPQNAAIREWMQHGENS